MISRPPSSSSTKESTSRGNPPKSLTVSSGSFPRDSSRVLRRAGVSRVAVLEGGFDALHETLRRAGKLDILVDHSAVCAACARHRLDQAMDSLRDLGRTIASSAGQLAATAGKESLREIGSRGKSLFSRAFQWTREKGAALVQEVSKATQSVVATQETMPVDASVFTVEECENDFNFT